MSSDLDMVYNNYLIEEKKHKEYIETCQTIYICIFVIHYNLLVYFYCLDIFLQYYTYHKFKFNKILKVL